MNLHHFLCNNFLSRTLRCQSCLRLFRNIYIRNKYRFPFDSNRFQPILFELTHSNKVHAVMIIYRNCRLRLNKTYNIFLQTSDWEIRNTTWVAPNRMGVARNRFCEFPVFRIRYDGFMVESPSLPPSGPYLCQKGKVPELLEMLRNWTVGTF